MIYLVKTNRQTYITDKQEMVESSIIKKYSEISEGSFSEVVSFLAENVDDKKVFVYLADQDKKLKDYLKWEFDI